MNDLDLIRTVLDDVPGVSQARLVAGRERLLATVSAGDAGDAAGVAGVADRVPRSRRRWRVVVPAGAALAAAAAAVTAFAVTGGGAVAPKSYPAAHGTQSGQSRPSVAQVNLAAKVLAIAARTVASEPATEPAAGQWIYWEFVSAWNGKFSGSPDNEWITFDGTESAYYGSPSDGAPVQLIIHHVPAGAMPSSSPGTGGLAAFDNNAEPLTAYNALAALPTSPAALLAAVDADIVASNQTIFGVMGTAGSTGQKEFAYLGQLLWNSYAAAPPSALAAVYRAIATIPGVTVRQGLIDAAGRSAVGVTDNNGKTELLLDPQTYQVVGINLWTPGPKGLKGPKGSKGSKGAAGTQSIAYLRIAEVSGPGQR
jgi:hypothetical protein